jgi:3-hydroxyisobutyrate dehydrogenase-like beta-hydroxyacid dehydrogenase
MSHLPAVAFIGVGNMGNPMAANLIQAGYALTVFDSVQAKTDNLVALGARCAGSLAEAVAHADVVMTSLPGPPQVAQVMLGDTGVLAWVKASATVIDTSTSSVDLVQTLVQTAHARGVDFLEAPVTNAVDMAALGRLSIFVGGDKACYEKHLPLFNVIGEKIFHCGKPGNAATVKLLTNLLWFVGAATIGEALMLGAKAGVPLEVVQEAITSSAGDSWVARHDIPSIFAGHYDPSFSLALCCKDLGLVNEIAQAQGYSLTMGAHAQALFEEARAHYGDDAAELHVVKLLEERVGMLLRPPHGQPVKT